MKRLLYRGRIISLYNEDVTLPNGRKTNLDIIEHPGACAIIPVLDDGRIVLVRQYRHAARGYIYEIPAGTLHKNESPLACAKRELVEEAGFKAKKWKKLISIRTTPGFTNEKIHIYLATGLTLSKTAHDFDEVMDVRIVSKKRLKSMLTHNKIIDAKTLVGLYIFLNK